MALLRQVPVFRALGQRERAEAAIAEAKSVIASCPDPGILADQLTAAKRSPRPPARPGQDLTERERTVLRLLKSGLHEREIGDELYVSRNTVHSHVQSIYRKLAVSTRAEAARTYPRTRPLRATRRNMMDAARQHVSDRFAAGDGEPGYCHRWGL